jgi:hypothetical protein
LHTHVCTRVYISTHACVRLAGPGPICMRLAYWCLMVASSSYWVPKTLLVASVAFKCGRERRLGFLGGFNWDLCLNWKMVSSPNCVFGGRNWSFLLPSLFVCSSGKTLSKLEDGFQPYWVPKSLWVAKMPIGGLIPVCLLVA